MKTFRTQLIINIFTMLAVALSNSAQAGIIDHPQLVGHWTGQLAVPGGSRQVSITIAERTDGTTVALLDVTAAKLKNSPMRVVSSADSVAFYADNAGCRFVALPVAEGKRLRGQWQQPGFRTTLVLDRTPTGAAPAASALKGMSMAYKTEEVRVSSLNSPNPELGLGGSLSMPLGAGPFPAVVLLADGSKAERAEGTYNLLDELADYLTRQGLAVLRLDSRGTGRSAAIPAANSRAELVADAQSALTFLRAHADINPLRVGLLGHGDGANVALQVAAVAPAPAFLVSLGAAGVNGQELLARQTSLVNQPGEPDTAQLAWDRKEMQVMTLARREAKKQLAAGTSAQQVQVRVAQEQMRLDAEAQKRSDALYKRQYAMLEIIRQTADNAQAQAIVANMLKQLYPGLPSATAQKRAAQLTSPWYRSLLASNPQTDLGKVSCPTLLLHGTADSQVLTATNLPLLEKGLKANKHVNSQKLDGLNHDFLAPASAQALAAGTEQHPAASADALEAIREWVVQQVKL
ncbi:alpha/beta hydrolase family protein [Hymenobacter convexus]|uniref:alpha/beta hydrolase family protein n=1 Tax=Hymenobacter sp. CA1UV-4 TaxID=3063782 RepID=UPI00271423A1|nr:alpha/beta fold hydrolase [Hymenobacter sp. CA1UV-4]MDO7851133.1 alpha/beta hydrolase [Hymenobacter sp. CA1UV-4]